MDRANDGVSSRRGGGGGAETRRWTKLSQRKRVVLSISKLRTSPSQLWKWRDSGKEVHSLRCRAAMRCDALRGGRFRWWFGPCRLGVCWRWSQPAVLAPNARTGSWLQRPCWPSGPLTGPLGPGILPGSFFQPPTMLCRPMPIPPSAFRPFRPRSGRLDL